MDETVDVAQVDGFFFVDVAVGIGKVMVVVALLPASWLEMEMEREEEEEDDSCGEMDCLWSDGSETTPSNSGQSGNGGNCKGSWDKRGRVLSFCSLVWSDTCNWGTDGTMETTVGEELNGVAWEEEEKEHDFFGWEEEETGVFGLSFGFGFLCGIMCANASFFAVYSSKESTSEKVKQMKNPKKKWQTPATLGAHGRGCVALLLFSFCLFCKPCGFGTLQAAEILCDEKDVVDGCFCSTGCEDCSCWYSSCRRWTGNKRSTVGFRIRFFWTELKLSNEPPTKRGFFKTPPNVEQDLSWRGNSLLAFCLLKMVDGSGSKALFCMGVVFFCSVSPLWRGNRKKTEKPKTILLFLNRWKKKKTKIEGNLKTWDYMSFVSSQKSANKKAAVISWVVIMMSLLIFFSSFQIKTQQGL